MTQSGLYDDVVRSDQPESGDVDTSVSETADVELVDRLKIVHDVASVNEKLYSPIMVDMNVKYMKLNS